MTRIFVFFTLFGALTLSLLAMPAFASSAYTKKTSRDKAPLRYASIIVDADTNKIIHARQIDGARFPASLTKIMTLYLTFDALNSGQIGLDEPLRVSRRAAAIPPVELGLKTGQSITTRQAIMALSVRSANDVAVVLAERLAGSETAFAEKMTRKARELGMVHTTFKTASGLPHPDQTTTAREMAQLAAALLKNHRRYYHYLGQKTFTWKGRKFTNSNSLLGTVAGVDGFKTGYTRASGYNLVISAQRDGQRIIAVVLGGASGKSRDKHMRDLVERGFSTLGKKPLRSAPPLSAPAPPLIASRARTVNSPQPRILKTALQTQRPAQTSVSQAKSLQPAIYKAPRTKVTEIVRLRNRQGQLINVVTQNPHTNPPIKAINALHSPNWSIQLGAFTHEAQARKLAEVILGQKRIGLTPRNLLITSNARSGVVLYRARFTGFRPEQARAACKALVSVTPGCLVIAPGA